MAEVVGKQELFWFTDTVLLSVWVPYKVLAGWLGCLTAQPVLMGLMEFEWRGLISQWWWLGDRSWWISGAEASPDSHARLMNCEMRQTYKSWGQHRPGLTPPHHHLPPTHSTHPPQSTIPLYDCERCDACIHLPAWIVAEVIWLPLLGALETTHHPNLGLSQLLKSFNDGACASIISDLPWMKDLLYPMKKLETALYYTSH